MSFKKKQAFTLTELLVVVIVIGVLSAVVLPKFNKVIETRKTTEAEELMAAVRTEQERRCALDKNYLADLSKLTDVLPSSNTKNFSYSVTSTGIEAQSKGKYGYTLKMPSYRDGRVCCESAEECAKLNKDYPLCSDLIAYADYQSGAECAGEIEPKECVGAATQACGCKGQGTQTRTCDTTTGQWGAWSECTAPTECECKDPQPVSSQTCNECGTQTRTVTCNTATGQWDTSAWTQCDKEESECQVKTCGEWCSTVSDPNLYCYNTVYSSEEDKANLDASMRHSGSYWNYIEENLPVGAEISPEMDEKAYEYAVEMFEKSLEGEAFGWDDSKWESTVSNAESCCCPKPCGKGFSLDWDCNCTCCSARDLCVVPTDDGSCKCRPLEEGETKFEDGSCGPKSSFTVKSIEPVTLFLEPIGGRQVLYGGTVDVVKESCNKGWGIKPGTELKEVPFGWKKCSNYIENNENHMCDYCPSNAKTCDLTCIDYRVPQGLTMDAYIYVTCDRSGAITECYTTNNVEWFSLPSKCGGATCSGVYGNNTSVPEVIGLFQKANVIIKNQSGSCNNPAYGSYGYLRSVVQRLERYGCVLSE